jgi:hypothetical protein
MTLILNKKIIIKKNFCSMINVAYIIIIYIKTSIRTDKEI